MRRAHRAESSRVEPATCVESRDDDLEDACVAPLRRVGFADVTNLIDWTSRQLRIPRVDLPYRRCLVCPWRHQYLI